MTPWAVVFGPRRRIASARVAMIEQAELTRVMVQLLASIDLHLETIERTMTGEVD